MKIKMRNKYNNSLSLCFLGHFHHSRGEARYCDFLFSQKINRKIYDFAVQAEFNLVGGIHHIVDFVVWKQKEDYPQEFEVHEFKGYKTDVWRIKKKLFTSAFPDIPYKVIESKEERIRKCRTKLKHPILKRVARYR